MIASYIGHDQCFAFGEARKCGLFYQFVGGFVVAPISFNVANVVQQPGTVQQIPILIIKSVETGGTIKECDCQSGILPAMVFFKSTTPS